MVNIPTHYRYLLKFSVDSSARLVRPNVTPDNQGVSGRTCRASLLFGGNILRVRLNLNRINNNRE